MTNFFKRKLSLRFIKSILISKKAGIILTLALISLVSINRLYLSKRATKTEDLLFTPLEIVNLPSPSAVVPTTPTEDPDPYINCKLPYSGIHPNIRKSECDQYTDCQLGDKWIFYKSRDKCLEDQKNYVPEYMKVFAKEFKVAQDKYEQACGIGQSTDTKKLSSNECIQATNTYNTYMRTFINLMGGSTTDLEIQDKLNELIKQVENLQE